MIDVKKSRAICEAATEGPWTVAVPGDGDVSRSDICSRRRRSLGTEL